MTDNEFYQNNRCIVSCMCEKNRRSNILLTYQEMYIQRKVVMLTIPVILVFCLTAILSAFVFHDHHHRKMFVGSIGLAASIAMYGSPLVVMVSHFLLE